MVKIKGLIISALAITMALFHLYTGGIHILPSLQQRGLHFGLGIALIFLLYPTIKSRNIERPGSIVFFIDLFLAFSAFLLGIYFFNSYLEIIIGLVRPSTLLVVTGLISIIITLEATRRIIGWTLPVIAVIFLVYATFGQNLPLLLSHSGYSLERIFTEVGLSSEGLFGVTLGVSATYVVLFILFGSFLEKSGAGKLLIDLAFSFVGRFRGGPAKVAVLASAFTGSVSGYSVSNVATTGVITIPLMKKSGYTPRYAAAVEAAASSGSMILPPVMGAVAFLMADFLQMEFYKVAFAALIPALLYYISIFFMIDLRSAQMEANNKTDYKLPSLKEELRKKGHLLIPLVILIYLLMVEMVPPALAAFWGTITIPPVCLLRKETRMDLKKISEALVQGIKLSLVVVAACATAGIVIGVINLTGVGLRLSSILITISGENLFFLLLLTMVASIVLGMGLPPVASYIILAVVAAPAIMELGVPALAAHLFIFYYGSFSTITPPLAIASFTASGIANSDPIKTSLTSVRLAIVAFVVPFVFVYGPELLLIGSAFEVTVAVITALIGIYALAVAVEGYLKNKVTIPSRILLGVGSILMLSVGIFMDIIGFVIILLVFVYELKFRKVDENKIKISDVIEKV